MREDWSKISKERLAELFPVILEDHNPQWKDYYLRESIFLQSVFGNNIKRINHIGSSSVAGLIAKPVVDILLEISQDTDIEMITEKMLDEGYVINAGRDTYIKGYTPRGFEGQAAHIHVRHSADWGELYFRDYLILHPDTAKEYGMLKTELKKKYMRDRDGYTDAKGQFINKYTELARKEFSDKYKPEL